MRLEVRECEIFGIPQFIKYFGERFNHMVTSEVYAEYQKFWKGVQTNKISFSEYITKFTDYKVKSVSINGIKRRVFIKKTYEQGLYAEFGILDFVEHFHDELDRMTLDEAYGKYLEFWNGGHVSKAIFGYGIGSTLHN